VCIHSCVSLLSLNMSSAIMVAYVIFVVLPQDSFAVNALRGDVQAPVALLEELEELLGSENRMATQQRVDQLETALRPMFLAMPKTETGTLKPDGVRYLLHRLFVEKHGWFVRGLDNAGKSWNASSPSALFKEHVGDEVHDVFEKKLLSKGFTLHDGAIMAATLESLVRADTMDRLRAAYRLVDMPADNSKPATEDQVLAAVDTYMLMYILGATHDTMTKSKLMKYQKEIHKKYPTWEDTRLWVRQVRSEVLLWNPELAPTSFNATERTLELMEDRYGKWQNKECLDLKASLLKMEDAGSGRVRLGTFYSSALNGNWQFSESIEYLKLLGALDESEPSRLRVIVPNYVNAPSNCVASSRFYSVCCMDECDPLMKHLETGISAPETSPSRIIQLVSNLASATVHAPRLLTPSLVQKLNDIAVHHSGTVPLHGRLFAQWMHHAYPRECPYPHPAGTTAPKNPMQWMEETGMDTIADEHTMRKHAEEQAASNAQNQKEDLNTEYLPWLHQEEIFVARQSSDRSSLRSALRALAMLAAVFAMVLNLKQSWRSLRVSTGAQLPHYKRC